MSSRRSQAWLLSAGIAISFVFLWLALRKIDFAVLLAAIVRADYRALAVCGFSLAAGIALRAARWCLIARQPLSSLPYFLRATNLGALSNLLFPARAGEVIRTLALMRATNIPLSRSIASTVIDRLIDALVLVASGTIVYCLVPVHFLIERWLLVLAAAISLIAVALVIFAATAWDWDTFLSRILGKFANRWSIRSAVFLNELRDELQNITRRWRGLKLAAAILLVWSSDYGSTAAVLAAFHIRMTAELPLLLWVFLAAGTTLPSAPGYIGIYQIAAVWALSIYSIPASISVAVAVSLQATVLLVACLMAGPSLPELFRMNLARRNLRSDFADS